MGNYLLCKRALAQFPFHIESIHLNIYSIEEMCYFLSTNLAMADEVVTEPTFSVWLSEECGLKREIKEFDALSDNTRQLSPRLNWLFAKSHYFSENELRKLKIDTAALDMMDETKKQKKKADALLKFGKYMRSIDCYKKIIESEQAKKKDDSFKASVYNNLGCAFARLFQSAAALEYFSKAYALEKSDRYLGAYLKAAYFDGGDAKLKDISAKLQVSDETAEKVRNDIASVKEVETIEDMDNLLKEGIRRYHSGADR